jgi:hypothetical protein
MTPTDSAAPTKPFSVSGEATLRRIRFVRDAGAAQEVLLEFPAPVPQKAVDVPGGLAAAGGEGIDVLTVIGQPGDQLGASDELLRWVADAGSAAAEPPIAITMHGAQIVWGVARAAVLAAPGRSAPLVLALVDFSYCDNELRKLEREIAEGWAQLEADMPLAHEVAGVDRERWAAVGRRTELALKRRAHLARIEPLFTRARAHLPPLANQLVERLRERTQVEERLESLASQLEVFVRVYEMTGQRISDFRAARQDRALEWVIIVLLAAESLLLLIEVLGALKG